MYYPIDEGTARAAHDMMSFRDYQPGSATAEYRALVDKAAALVEWQKQAVSSYYHDKLDALLDRYARQLADWTNAYNRNGASCPSVMISGGSNFPVKKKLKQNARENSLWQQRQTIDAILDKIKGIGTGPVDLPDPHAREILTDQLNAARQTLDYCKAGNAYFRKHKTLRGYGNLTDGQADKLTDPEDFGMRLYGKPYPDYELTSLRGKIKRLEARLAELDKLQSPPHRIPRGKRRANRRGHHRQPPAPDFPRQAGRGHPRAAQILRFPLVSPRRRMAAPAYQQCPLRSKGNFV